MSSKSGAASKENPFRIKGLFQGSTRERLAHAERGWGERIDCGEFHVIGADIAKGGIEIDQARLVGADCELRARLAGGPAVRFQRRKDHCAKTALLMGRQYADALDFHPCALP